MCTYLTTITYSMYHHSTLTSWPSHFDYCPRIRLDLSAVAMPCSNLEKICVLCMWFSHPMGSPNMPPSPPGPASKGGAALIPKNGYVTTHILQQILIYRIYWLKTQNTEWRRKYQLPKKMRNGSTTSSSVIIGQRKTTNKNRKHFSRRRGDKGRRGQTHEEPESMPGAEKMGATKAGGGKLTKSPSQCLGPRRCGIKTG